MSRNYSVEKYTANWKRRFRVQEKLLKKILGVAAVEIHHVGSTSVSGMSAKPIIDMLVILKDFHAIDHAKSKFEKLGYVFRSNYVKPNSRLLEKFKGETKLYNIHFFRKNHQHAQRIIVIRDYLRTHPDMVKAYELIKKKLQKKHPGDYRAYSHGKNKFLDTLARRASVWAKKSGQ